MCYIKQIGFRWFNLLFSDQRDHCNHGFNFRDKASGENFSISHTKEK